MKVTPLGEWSMATNGRKGSAMPFHQVLLDDGAKLEYAMFDTAEEARAFEERAKRGDVGMAEAAAAGAAWRAKYEAWLATLPSAVAA